MSVDKLIDSAQLESDLTDVADAIRVKTGGTADLAFPADFVSEIGGIETGGSGFTWDDLASNQTPTGAVSFETATAISAQAFYNRKGITSVDLTGITSIGDYAFAEDSNITEITGTDDLLTIKQYAFRNCNKLGWLYFPKVTSTGNYMFYGAGKIGYGAVFPSLSGSLSAEFTRSGNYTVFDFGPNLTALGTRTFYNTSRTYTVILRNTNAVVTATATNCLDMKADSKVYVPSALIEDYQVATNWSTKYAAGVEFLPIEGSIYETQYADGTPIPTT